MNGLAKVVFLAVCAIIGRYACCGSIPLRCLIVEGEGGVSPVSAEAVSNKVGEINRIFRQAFTDVWL